MLEELAPRGTKVPTFRYTIVNSPTHLQKFLRKTPQAWLGAADLREPSERDRKQRGNDYDLADEPDLARMHAVLDGRISDTDKVAAPVGMGEGNSFPARNQA